MNQAQKNKKIKEVQLLIWELEFDKILNYNEARMLVGALQDKKLLPKSLK